MDTKFKNSFSFLMLVCMTVTTCFCMEDDNSPPPSLRKSLSPPRIDLSEENVTTGGKLQRVDSTESSESQLVQEKPLTIIPEFIDSPIGFFMLVGKEDCCSIGKSGNEFHEARIVYQLGKYRIALISHIFNEASLPGADSTVYFSRKIKCVLDGVGDSFISFLYDESWSVSEMVLNCVFRILDSLNPIVSYHTCCTMLLEAAKLVVRGYTYQDDSCAKDGYDLIACLRNDLDKASDEEKYMIETTCTRFQEWANALEVNYQLTIFNHLHNYVIPEMSFFGSKFCFC